MSEAGPTSSESSARAAGLPAPVRALLVVGLLYMFLVGVKLLEVTDIAGGVQMTMEFTFECEGATKPSCVAEIIFRSYV